MEEEDLTVIIENMKNQLYMRPQMKKFEYQMDFDPDPVKIDLSLN